MKISIVIPSRHREASLLLCLQALQKQQVQPDEVLVIENASKKHYSLKNIQPTAPFRIRHLLEKTRGKSSARNLGITEAAGDIIVFLDDDCQPKREWLQAIRRSFTTPAVVAVLGASQEQDTSLLLETYLFQYEKFFLQLRINEKSGIVRCGAALNTRNCAVRKKFLSTNKILFDTRYNHYFFAEDTDFGEQIERAGGKLVYNKKAVVWHSETADFLSLLRKKFLNGRAMYVLQQKGIFHKKDLRRKWTTKLFQRTTELLAGKTFLQAGVALVFLNALFLAYRIGYNLERLHYVFYQSRSQQ